MTTIKPRTAKVVIFQGDDLDRLSSLDAAVQRAEVRNAQAEKAAKSERPRLMHEDAPAVDVCTLDAAKADRDEFAAEAEERGVAVVLNALDRKAWRDMTAAHPPRDGEDGDSQFGVNMDTFPDALLPASVDRETSTIEGDTVGFLDGLSNYDYYDRLFLAAFALNRGSAMADPTLRLA